MTWKQLIERDRREWKLSAIDPHDRDTWRSGVRSATRKEARCLEGGPLLWIWPLYLHVNPKSDDDDDDDDPLLSGALWKFEILANQCDTFFWAKKKEAGDV